LLEIEAYIGAEYDEWLSKQPNKDGGGMGG
jgi:hypothetical protein